LALGPVEWQSPIASGASYSNAELIGSFDEDIRIHWQILCQFQIAFPRQAKSPWHRSEAADGANAMRSKKRLKDLLLF
jgi:hypothetical protein